MLNPPGGASSNIFGSDPDPHQQQRQQQHREIADSNQNQSAQYSVPPAGQTQEPKQEDLHSRNRPTKKGRSTIGLDKQHF